MTDEGPFCPECAEPVSADTEYCLHCYQDFSGDVSPVDAPPGDASAADVPDSGAAGSSDGSGGHEEWQQGGGEVLDPDGLLDNTLTVIVGIVAGLIIGFIGIFASVYLIERVAPGNTKWGFLLGVVVWLGTTAHLIQRRTVQGAVSHAGYALAVILMSTPLVAAVVSGPGIEDRIGAMFFALMFVTIPAMISGGVGWFASKFVPESDGKA